MPRPGKMDRVQEKPKNFFGSLLKLFRNLRTWKVLMVISLILAVAGSIFSLIAPNQLSKLTDEITLGIKPDTDKLVEITTAIMNNTNQEVLTIDGVTISLEDQYKYLEIAKNIDKDNQQSMLEAFDKLPDSIYSLVKPKMNIDAIKHIAIVLAILYVLGAIFNYIMGLNMATISNSFAKRLRSNITYKINQLPLSYFDKHETGDILSNIFGFVFMALVLSKSQKYFNQRQKILGDINGYVEEMYSGHTVVKTYNADPNRISISGHSYGAVQSYQMVNTYPNYYAACIPISGSTDVTSSFKDTKVWAFHGGFDNKGSISKLDDVKTRLSQIDSMGGDTQLYVFDRMGHAYVQDKTYEGQFESPDGKVESPLEWAFKQTKA